MQLVDSRRVAFSGSLALFFALCAVATPAFSQSMSQSITPSDSVTSVADTPDGLGSLPDAPAGMRGVGMGGVQGGPPPGKGMGGPPPAGRGGFHGSGPHDFSTPQSFDWSRFVSNMAQVGSRYALGRLSSGSGSGGGAGAGSRGFGGSSFSGASSFQSGSMSGGSMNGGSMSGGVQSGMGSGPGGGPGFGAGGGMSMFSLGGGLLHALAASSGGTMGSTLNLLSRATDFTTTGVNLPTKSSGVDFSISASMTNLLQGIGTEGGGGGQGGGSMGGGSMSGGRGAGGNAPPGGGGGRGPGASLSLHLKF